MPVGIPIHNLYVLRKQRGWSVKELAQRAGLSRITVGFIETGRSNPTPASLRKLAQALHVSPARLRGEEGR